MLKHRVIPVLLLRDGGLVKTRRFKAPTYVGDPINAIRIFNEKEVDELVLLDIVASKRSHEPDYAMIGQMVDECSMPFCYGGGVRSVDQAARLFDLGVEKVSLQSGALADIGLVSDLATRFGSQSLVVSIDVKRDWCNRPVMYDSRLARSAKTDWLDFARQAVAAGAGELLINAVDRDGEMSGYDLDVIRQAAAAVTVPLIALGGASNLADFKAAVEAGASAVAAGALFVFHGPHRAVLLSYPRYADLERCLGTQP